MRRLYSFNGFQEVGLQKAGYKDHLPICPSAPENGFLIPSLHPDSFRPNSIITGIKIDYQIENNQVQTKGVLLSKINKKETHK